MSLENTAVDLFNPYTPKLSNTVRQMHGWLQGPAKTKVSSNRSVNSKKVVRKILTAKICSCGQHAYSPAFSRYLFVPTAHFILACVCLCVNEHVKVCICILVMSYIIDKMKNIFQLFTSKYKFHYRQHLLLYFSIFKI